MSENLINIIKSKLKQAFQPMHLEVVDNSHLHKEHQEYNQDKIHININITAECFKEVKVLERHKQIYETLREEILKIHAISITALCPKAK